MANILNVTPMLAERVVDHQVCDSEFSQRSSQPQTAVNKGSVIGTIAGALLGNQVGGGNGRLAAVAVGAAVGGLTGDRLNERQVNSPACRQAARRETYTSAYLVTYEYQGNRYQASLPYDPSRGGSVYQVPVNVSVTLK
jgi:uncharacterized protein YcfJ